MARHDTPDLPENVIVPSPTQQLAAIQMLAALEGAIGKLERMEKAVKLPDLPTPWPWSWDPDQVSLFMASWDSPALLVIPRLRDLAFTETPDGKAHMYERACVPHVREAIERSQAILAVPVGSIPAWPAGDCSYDLRPSPPGMRPTGVTINFWHFRPQVIRGISAGFRVQVAEIRGRSYAAGIRLTQQFDHMMELAPVDR